MRKLTLDQVIAEEDIRPPYVLEKNLEFVNEFMPLSKPELAEKLGQFHSAHNDNLCRTAYDLCGLLFEKLCKGDAKAKRAAKSFLEGMPSYALMAGAERCFICLPELTEKISRILNKSKRADGSPLLDFASLEPPFAYWLGHSLAVNLRKAYGGKEALDLLANIVKFKGDDIFYDPPKTDPARYGFREFPFKQRPIGARISSHVINYLKGRNALGLPTPSGNDWGPPSKDAILLLMSAAKDLMMLDGRPGYASISAAMWLLDDKESAPMGQVLVEQTVSSILKLQDDGEGGLTPRYRKMGHLCVLMLKCLKGEAMRDEKFEFVERLMEENPEFAERMFKMAFHFVMDVKKEDLRCVEAGLGFMERMADTAAWSARAEKSLLFLSTNLYKYEDIASRVESALAIVERRKLPPVVPVALKAASGTKRRAKSLLS